MEESDPELPSNFASAYGHAKGSAYACIVLLELWQFSVPASLRGWSAGPQHRRGRAGPAAASC